MALEKWVDSNAKKLGNQFRLLDDGDTANVIFLYQSIDDVLREYVHYLKSSNYSGDVFCLGRGCPACQRGVRVKHKLFIPLFNLSKDKFEIWYIDEAFMDVLRTSVFKAYPNPSEVVFQVTRQGAARDSHTRYQIIAIGKNGSHPYDALIKEHNINIEASVDEICKEFDVGSMTTMLNEYADSRQNRNAYQGGGYNNNGNYGNGYSTLPDYQVTPRGSSATPMPREYVAVSEDYDDLPDF